ncbi:GNAT family N-acetyltransferase [Xylanimonas oleitrophica]|uniref:GNAT family N-acetyltransferase n=1 Tax=Xylanimonas oleitrophica TaxID=2607479 RepID=UPI0015CFB4BF|nr:GNAT family N-acetyltransferase [Xylanimonas oleitrophica]
MSLPTPAVVRRATFDDAEAARRLGHEGFGVPASPLPGPTADAFPGPHTRPWVATDGDEVVATLRVRSHTTWFHGARLPTAGIAGVTVAAEHRGRGLLRPLFEAVVGEALEQGEVVSTLFPSSAGIYTGLGYAGIASHDTVRIPLAALDRVPRPGTTTRARRATVEDLPAIVAVYDAWASAQNGTLTRQEDPFRLTAEELFGPDAESTAVTVAVQGPADGPEAGQVVGFCTWARGTGGYRHEAPPLQVSDLVALTPDAARALWRVLGSSASVVREVDLQTSGSWTHPDPASLVLPDRTAALVDANPYMLRVLDVPAALGAARVAPVEARVRFAVAGPGDDLGPGGARLRGAWLLETSGGAVQVVRDGDDLDGRPVLTPAGLAASYAGATSTANLRVAGHLSGPDTHDLLWDALWGGRDVHVRDAF